MKRADIATLRNHNSTLVLGMIRRMQPISMKEIADRSGLQPSTVSRLLRSMADQGFVTSAGMVMPKSSGGRPAEQWVVNGEYGACIGVYLASNLVAGVSVDINCRLIDSLVIPIEGAEAATAPSLTSAVRQAVNRLCEPKSLGGRPCLGVGIASMGLVDPQSDSLRYFDLDLKIKSLLPQKFGLPITANDANVVALGEAMHGSLVDVRNAVVLYAHEGMGAGLIIDGRLVTGFQGAAGELGYRNCQLVANPLLDEPVNSREVFLNGVCSLVNLLNPEIVLCTGDLDELPDVVYEELKKRVATQTNRVARQVAFLKRPCDPMGVARHMATITLDERVFRPGHSSLLTTVENESQTATAMQDTAKAHPRRNGN